jgi:hypothetical protein
VRYAVSGEYAMTTTIGQMTQDEFREFLELVIEQKLRELLDDPDIGLELNDTIHELLERQRADVVAGERGMSRESVRVELGME